MGDVGSWTYFDTVDDLEESQQYEWEKLYLEEINGLDSESCVVVLQEEMFVVKF